MEGIFVSSIIFLAFVAGLALSAGVTAAVLRK